MRILFILSLSAVLMSSTSGDGTVTTEVVIPGIVEKIGTQVRITGSPYQLILVRENEIQRQQTLKSNSENIFEVQSNVYTLIYP